MPIFLHHLIRSFARLRTGVLPTALIVMVFLTSWPLMILAEPAGAEITEPRNYWWWFLVTASTVGYGDYFPVSSAGHLVGGYVIVGGIATLTTLFAQLAGVIERARGRRMKGSATLDASNHVVVLGYTPGRTERVVDELLAYGGRRVVLCAWDEVGTHPLPDRDLDFVRGELTSDGVLRRAGVHRARSVLVDVRDDNEALAVLVAVDHVAPTAHLVVALRDMDRCRSLRYVNDQVHCVQWHSVRLVTEELQSPGISQVYAELMTHGVGNTYSVPLPDAVGEVAFGDCQLALGRRYGATVLAARTAGQLLVSPSWPTPLPAGTVLYYVSRREIAPDELATALRGRAGVDTE